jgi:hypothetical protein
MIQESEAKAGPLWTPTLEVQRLFRECQRCTDTTMRLNRRVLEGLLYDSLLWRESRGLISRPEETANDD